MARRKSAQPNSTASAVDESVPTPPLVEISAEEQWRLINQTGVLHKVANSAQTSVVDHTATSEPSTLGDELFNTSLYTIPASSLLLLMEILVQRQYSHEPTLQQITDRMVPGVPIIALFTFYTLRHKQSRWMQRLLFMLAIGVGCTLIHTVNRANWKVQIQRNPPLATAWVFAIVQLDLLYAVASLAVVALWTWWKGFSLTP